MKPVEDGEGVQQVVAVLASNVDLLDEIRQPRDFVRALRLTAIV
jgi:hypothetical protein